MFWTFLQTSIRFSTVFMYGVTGETITEKSGHLNLGIPGIMCIGAIGGALGESVYLKSLNDISNISGFGAIMVPILFTLLFAGLAGLLFSFFTVTLRCNQNVTGLTITTFGVGFFGFMKNRIDQTGFNVAKQFFIKGIASADSGWFQQMFLSYGVLVYLAIAIAIIVAIVIKRTRTGLNLRAVGENPATADAMGISVTKYRYISTILGSAIAGLGGLFYIMDYSGSIPEVAVDSYGWLAVALVIFTVWKPNWGILGSILFGALLTAPNFINVSSYNKEILKLIPYVVTVLVLIVTSIVNKRETQPPAALGVSYFREER